MAKMKLYYSPGSPYARKVRIVAMETKLERSSWPRARPPQL